MRIVKILIWIVVGLALLIAVAGYVLAQKSQDGAAPGLVDGVLSSCPDKPNCVVSEAGASSQHQIDPFPVAAWATLPAAIDDVGGGIVSTEPAYIAATFRSPLMGFVDDVEFRLAEDVVHVRSASRVGHEDLSANRERIEAIRQALSGCCE